MSGLPYSYTLKEGKHGGLTKELWVDRRENSKSITWSSVRMAFQNVLKMKESLSEGEKPYVKRPKALGDIRGISYICLLYTSDAADEEDSVDLGGRRRIKKKKK